MQLDEKSLNILFLRAIDAAKSAGEIIKSYTGKEITVERKEGGDSLQSQVVTKVDRLCEEAVLKVLEPTCEEYKLGILTEESVDNKSRLETEYFWCIDPLDGTLPFIESTHGYSVSIALVRKNGIPVIGVIYDPFKDILYTALKDKGAQKNGMPMKISSEKSSKLILIFDRSFTKQDHFGDTIKTIEKKMSRKGFKSFEIIKHGGGALNACWVLEQAPACYFKFPKKKEGGGSLWDYAASTCIFNEINAIATDVYGDPLDLNRADSTFMNHKGVLYASDEKVAKLIRKAFKKRIN